MKYHTDVPSTIPSLHTWIRLRGRESPISRGCICSIRPSNKENNLPYLPTYSPSPISFFIRLGLNKYGRGTKREKFRRNRGWKSIAKRKEGKILAVCCLTKSNGRCGTSPRNSPQARHRERGFYHRQWRVRYRRTNSGDYTGQTHKLHPMAFVLLSSIILALCTPPQESSDSLGGRCFVRVDRVAS